MDDTLILYKTQQELETRISSLLGWWHDRKEKSGLYRPQLFKCVDGSPWDEYWPTKESLALMKKFPVDHDIIKELLAQVKKHLQDITTQTREQLQIRNPFFLNSLELVGGHGYEELFEPEKKAAYHVVKAYPVTNDVPPQEHRLIHAALNGMRGYAQHHPDALEEFLDFAWERKASPIHIIGGYCEVSSRKAIDIYLMVVEMALRQGQFPTREIIRGKEVELFNAELMIDGIIKMINLKMAGQYVKRAFPSDNLREHYGHLNDRVVSFLDQNVFKQ